MQKTFENKIFEKKDHEKLTWFLPLLPVPIYGQDNEKWKRHGTIYQSLSELQSMFRKIPFLVWPFESGNCEEAKTKPAKYSIYFKNEKGFLEEVKTFFLIFEMLSFFKI